MQNKTRTLILLSTLIIVAITVIFFKTDLLKGIICPPGQAAVYDSCDCKYICVNKAEKNAIRMGCDMLCD